MAALMPSTAASGAASTVVPTAAMTAASAAVAQRVHGPLGDDRSECRLRARLTDELLELFRLYAKVSSRRGFRTRMASISPSL